MLPWQGKEEDSGTWKCFPEVTPVFVALSNAQEEIEDEQMTILERSNQAHGQPFQVLNIGAGFLMTESGDPCEPHYQRSLTCAKSW